MVHLVEEAHAHPFDRMPDRYHFRYAFRMDRPCMGSALQETYSSVMQKQKTAFVAVFCFFVFSLNRKNKFIERNCCLRRIKIFVRFWKKYIDKAKKMVYNDAIR